MEVVNLGTRVSGTEKYAEFHDITNKVFGKYKSDIKGTVAYQFTGCTGGKSGCHEDCAGAFPDKGYTEKSFCETHVGVYQDGAINIHYSPAKPCNILLLHSKVPVKFSKNAASKLKEIGVKTVKVNINGEITKYPVESMKITKEAPKEKCREDEGISLLWLIGLIVVILILLFVTWFAWKNGWVSKQYAAANDY